MNDLPPFSFSKKPIQEPTDHGSAHMNAHSNISDVLSAFSIKSKGKKLSNPPTGSGGPVYKDVDYDEKIRFPRMNNVNNYTYNPCVKPGLVSRNSSICPTDTSSIEASKEADVSTNTNADTENESNTGTENYSPATFDLTQPLRRFSFQLDSIEEITYTLKKYFSLEGSPISLSSVNEENLKLLKEYISNNYIYERNLENSSNSIAVDTLTKSGDSQDHGSPQNSAVSNNSNNTIKTESSHNSNTSKTSTVTNTSETANKSASNRSSMTNMTNATNISGMSKPSKPASTTVGSTHFYPMKKPLCTPAVLRPTVSSSQSDSSRTSHSLGQVCVNNSVYHITRPNEDEQPVVTEEPTHDHWKANGFTNHCMQCLTTFNYSIVSLVYSMMDQRGATGLGAASTAKNTTRRHHCRFCGHIFCDDCLVQSDEDSSTDVERLYKTSKGSFLGKGILLDEYARFIVPNYKSGNGGSIGSTMSNGSDKSVSSASSDSAVVDDPKLFKICKPCVEVYKNLVVEINSNPAMCGGASFVYVENPYANKGSPMKAARALIQSQGSLDSLSDRKQLLQPFTDGGRKLSDAMDPYRKSGRKDSGGVPSDWTWSSF